MTGAPQLDDALWQAIQRTCLAYDRTMMAWVRTATALMSFGFTIYKFFEIESKQAQTPPGLLRSAAQFGSLMIVIGIVAAVIAAIEQVRFLRRVQAEYGRVPSSPTNVIATIVGVVGLSGLAVVLLRL
jgi:putative membrane protein